MKSDSETQNLKPPAILVREPYSSRSAIGPPARGPTCLTRSLRFANIMAAMTSTFVGKALAVRANVISKVRARASERRAGH